MQKEISQKLRYFRIFSIITILLGVLLMTYMIKVEDEPGALPLLMVIIGIVGFLFNQIKIKNQIGKI